MADPSSAPDPASPHARRAHALRAIASERAGPLHFASAWAGLSIDRTGPDGACLSLPFGPQVVGGDGTVGIAPLALLADMALSVAMRQHVDPGVRMATVELHLQFTGEPADADLTATARLDGFSHGLAARQGAPSAVLQAGGRTVARARATFANPPLPPGTRLAPLVADARPAGPVPAPHELDAREREILRRLSLAGRRLRAASRVAPAPGFVEAFWGLLPRSAAAGRASTVLVPGPHIANRIGHVQGGILFGAAARTAMAAAPPSFRLTGASAWFLRPALAPRVRIASTLLQAGRTVAVVRTAVVSADGRPVLEMVSGHARPA